VADNIPFTLGESAIALHEMFTSLCDAGFTEAQSLTLIANLIKPRPEMNE
jgi:hypothetical protein